MWICFLILKQSATITSRLKNLQHVLKNVVQSSIDLNHKMRSIYLEKSQRLHYIFNLRVLTSLFRYADRHPPLLFFNKETFYSKFIFYSLQDIFVSRWHLIAAKYSCSYCGVMNAIGIMVIEWLIMSTCNAMSWPIRQWSRKTSAIRTSLMYWPKQSISAILKKMKVALLWQDWIQSTTLVPIRT